MNNKIKITLVGLTTILMVLMSETVSAHQGPMVTFRLDDGLTSQYNFALPILQKYNFPATVYIFTDPPEEGNWEGYMNWPQIEELHSVYGWEIGGHSKSHPDLTRLSNSQLVEELSGSRAIFENHGFTVKSFVSPFGYYNNKIVSYIARFYESHGSAWPYDFNSYPFSDYEISVQEVRNSTSLTQVKSWIDSAALNKKWLVLLFHEVVESNPGEYEYLKNNFEAVVDYVNEKNISVVTVSEALKLLNSNLVLNPGFESATSGWADNWLRTNTSYITLDTNNNGSFPNPKNSLKFTGGNNKYDAYTKDFIEVNPNKTYLLKVYFNCQNFSRGRVDVFIDEYDSNGNRLNWKWQTGIWSKYVGYKTITYTPSQSVTKLLIWIEAAAGSNLTCYVDNIVLADSNGSGTANSAPVITSIPVVTATPSTEYTYDVEATDIDGDTLTYSLTTCPTGMTIDVVTGLIKWVPTADQLGSHNITVQVSDGLLTDTQSWTVIVSDTSSNLVLNPSFEFLTGGWADNWLRTNTTSISIDTNSNGSLPYPKNSLKFIGSVTKSGAYTEDFLTINPNKKYLLKAYFNSQNFKSGGVDIFIDEYDSQGKWISWKWQTGIWSNYVGDKTITYIPSPSAAKILIWIESASGSNLTCYVDNVVLTEAP